MKRSKLYKMTAIELLSTSIASGNGGYASEYGPLAYVGLIQLITDGDKNYCKKHGHLKHASLDYCPICGQKTDVKGSEE